MDIAAPTPPPGSSPAEESAQRMGVAASGSVQPEFDWEMAGRWLFVLLLLIGLPIACSRVIHTTDLDFVTFYNAGAYLWEDGCRDPASGLCKYLPSADVVWMAISRLPLPVAAAAWYCLGAWSWIGLLGTIRRYLLPGLDDATSRQVVLLTGLLAMPLALDGLCLGAFHIFMVWAMIAGLGRISRDRPWSGAFLLGTAIWIKLLPLVGVAYLLLKRRWRPALLALAWAATIDVVLSVGGLGPQAAWNEHVRWWHREGSRSTTQQLTHHGLIDEDRLTNQSTMAVMRRFLTRFGGKDFYANPYVPRANLSADQLTAAYLLALWLLGAGVAVYCRRPAWATSPRQWSNEIALAALSTLWFSPVVWSYHPTAAAPALAVVLGKVAGRPAWAWAIACTWMAAISLLGLPALRAWGDLLWLSFALGAMLVWLVGETEETADERR